MSKNLTLEDYKEFLKKEVKDQFDVGMNSDYIKTGLLLYDEIIGGIPLGKYILISSKPGQGKTTLMVQLAQKIQEYKNNKLLYIDSEASMSRQRMLDLGLDVNNIIYSQPATIDSQGKLILTSLKHKQEQEDDEPFIFLVDSNTSLPPEQQIDDDDMVAKQPGVKQKINSQFLSKVINPLQRNNSTLIMISQLRTNITIGFGSFGGPSEDVIGGMALKYYQMQDIRLTEGSYKLDSIDLYGKIVHFRQVKNRLFSPNIRFDLILDFNRGFTNDLSNLFFFKQMKKEELKIQKFDDNPLKSSGGWWKFSFNGSEEYKFRQREFQDLYNTDIKFRKTYDSQIITFLRRQYRAKGEDGLHGEQWFYNPDEDELYEKTYLTKFGKQDEELKNSTEKFAETIGDNELKEEIVGKKNKKQKESEPTFED